VLSPIEVTESGIVTDSRLAQLVKAYLPIEVTESGMVIDPRPVQPSKA
jgi:hypothetical protein